MDLGILVLAYLAIVAQVFLGTVDFQVYQDIAVLALVVTQAQAFLVTAD